MPDVNDHTRTDISKLLDQILLCDLVVLESICNRTRTKRLINDSKTTGGLRKIWTGRACLWYRPNTCTRTWWPNLSSSSSYSFFFFFIIIFSLRSLVSVAPFSLREKWRSAGKGAHDWLFVQVQFIFDFVFSGRTLPIFFLQSSRIRVDLLSYESKTTGELRKIWTGKEERRILAEYLGPWPLDQIFFYDLVV